MARELKPELMYALGEATCLLRREHPKQADAIIEAVNLLGHKLAKTDSWTLFPPPPAADK